VDMDMDMDE